MLLDAAGGVEGLEPRKLRGFRHFMTARWTYFDTLFVQDTNWREVQGAETPEAQGF